MARDPHDDYYHDDPDRDERERDPGDDRRSDRARRAIEAARGRVAAPALFLIFNGLFGLVCVGLLSVPMIYKDHVLGVINVYSAEERVFSSEDVRVLTTVADQAALAFENTKLTEAVQESQEALLTRKVVERAKSILQRQANLSEEEAYKRLQQQSMRTRRSMKEIAEAVILSSEMQAGN